MNSEIILVKGINMDREYNNVLSYSENDMVTLCRANAIATSNNYSFIRLEKNKIKTHFNYNQCLQANYIAFRNPDYSNKWFFAWIDDVNFKGENNIEITFTVDAWSTWFDKWTKKACYVIREHVNDDTIGLHTIPENLDVNDVIIQEVTKDMSYCLIDDEGDIKNHWIVVETTYLPDANTSGEPNQRTGSSFQGIDITNGIVSGHGLVFFYINSASNTTLNNSYNNVALFIKRVNIDGHVTEIKNIYPISTAFLSLSNLNQYTASASTTDYTLEQYNFWLAKQNTFEPNYYDTTITKNHSFSDYTPKNNKLFCYPYNYLYVTNNNGANNIYKYENFLSNDCVFETQNALTIGGQVRTIPFAYKTTNEYNFDESLPLSKYPTFSWSSDAYTNWLTQNSVNIPTQILSVVGSLGSMLINPAIRSIC